MGEHLQQLHILPEILQRLQGTGICEINHAAIKLLFGPVIHQESRPHRYRHYICSNGLVTALAWRVDFRSLLFELESLFGSHILQELFGVSWRHILGFIRDQMRHYLCWDYVATDLVSAESVKCGWEDLYKPLCTWHVCMYCRPDFLGWRSLGLDGHLCYGYCVANALEYIRAAYGVPEEHNSMFSCFYRPPYLGELKDINERIRSVRTFQRLGEALALLRYHPIGADVVVFPELYRAGTEVYYGPLARNSGFGGYHAVIMESVAFYGGDLVAVCKMSNGVRAADRGYAYVSLTTKYMFVGSEVTEQAKLRPTPKPMHLLSNFVVLDMYKRGEKRPEKKEEDTMVRSQQPGQWYAASSSTDSGKEPTNKQEEEEDITERDERQRREGQENLQQQRMREMPENESLDAHDQQKQKEQIQSDDTDQVKPTVQSDEVMGIRLRDLEAYESEEGEGCDDEELE